MGEGKLREVVRLERAMRRLRLVLAVFAALQFWLYTPPPGQLVPFPRTGAAAAVIASLLVLNLVSFAAGTAKASRIYNLGLMQMAGDLLLALSIVWLFAFDSSSALWALLIVPIIEAAYRYRLKGAVLLWAACVAGYVVREVIAHSHGVPTDPASVTYRLGVLLIVALSVGWMADSLREESLRSERRAELLNAVARAGAATELTTPQVLDSVVQSLVALGYEASNIAVFSEVDDAYRIEAGRGLPAELTSEPWQRMAGIPRLVRERGEVVVAQDYEHHEAALEVFVQDGVRVAIGVPLSERGCVAGALIARSREHRLVSDDELEALRLLADQAGRALVNARRFEAERRSAEDHARASLRDELTGIGNRRHANELLRSLRPGDSVVLVDCDHFKLVNDTDGHAGGDAVLVALARYLREAVRDADAVARFGGEEFLVVVRGGDGNSAEVAERLVAGWRATRPRTTVSVGVAIHVEGRFPAVTLGEADAALFHAKRSGRDRACVFTESLLGSEHGENALR